MRSRRRAVALLALASALGACVAYAVTTARHGRFAIVTQQATRTTAPGGAVTWHLRLERTARTRGRVRLRVQGAPAGARLVWRRGGRRVRSVVGRRARRVDLRVRTRQATPEGTYRLRVTARRGRSVARRTLTLRLRRLPLGVEANLTTPLRPGLAVPLDVTLTNPYRRPLTLRRLVVAVDPQTSSAACSGGNFAVRQMPPTPLGLKPGSTRLSEALPPDQWPRVGMYDLPVNQDACKNVALTLSLSAQAGSR